MKDKSMQDEEKMLLRIFLKRPEIEVFHFWLKAILELTHPAESLLANHEVGVWEIL